MINLNQDERKSIIDGKHYIPINDNYYYVKKVNDTNDGIELVVERLAKLVNINCVHYERLTINNNVYYLSEDLNKDKNYSSASQIVMFKNKISDMLSVLNKNYNEEILFLIDEIIKIFIFDILLINYDRHLYNWGFIVNNNKIEKVYILDNEYSFYKIDKVKLSFLNNPGTMFNKSSDIIGRNLEDLDYFLSTSDSYYQELFKNMYDILNPEVVQKTFEEVEKDYNIKMKNKDVLISNYVENYNKIGELFRGRSLK